MDNNGRDAQSPESGHGNTEGERTLRLTPSNMRTVLLFVVMLIWFALGLSRYVAGGGLLMLALAIVGLAGALVYGLMLLPGSSYLEATPQGLTISTAFRKRVYSWQEIQSFSAESILSRRVVKYRLTKLAGAEEQGDASVREETLPDTYGMTAEGLAARLNAIRRRNLASPPPAS